MKQKIYSFIIIFVSVMIFLSFSLLNIKNDDTGEFEVTFISSNTEISETPPTPASTSAVSVKASSESAVDDTYRKITEPVTHTTTVASETEAPAVTEAVTESEQIIFPININTAGADELMLLDGIGENIARAIIEYREAYGGFKNRDELLEVEGIGDKRLSKIYDFIFVENEVYDSENIPDSDDVCEVYEDIPEEYNEYEEYSEPETVPEQTEPLTEEASEENIIVNLNTASAEDLMKLPYIDEKIAGDILNLRDTIQYFSHPYELLMVESLTQEQVAEIINFVTVE